MFLYMTKYFIKARFVWEIGLVFSTLGHLQQYFSHLNDMAQYTYPTLALLLANMSRLKATTKLELVCGAVQITI